MDTKKILLYTTYQYKNQLRNMSLKSKLFFALDWLDAFINPIFFSAIFFVINPDHKLILLVSNATYFFSMVNRLASTKKIVAKDNYGSSFQLVGLSKKDYMRGVDIINALPTFISNLIFSLFILVIISKHYPSIFYQALLWQNVLLLFLPCILWVRLLLIKFSQSLLLVLSKAFTYQVWVVLIVVSRMANINYNQPWLIVILVLSLCFIIGIYGVKGFFSTSSRKSNSLLMIEFKIALVESNFSSLNMLFFAGMWLLFSSAIMVRIQSEFPYSQYAISFNIIGLAHVYIPLIILSLIHTGLAYYYGYDLEGVRMITERYLGEFINHKIKYKLFLAYLLSVIPYLLFIGVYLFFGSLSFEVMMRYVVAYCLGFLLQPLSFFVGTMLFPNYHRSMFDFEQRMSNASLIFGFIMSSLLALGSGYYVWRSSDILSPYLLIPLLLNIGVLAINLFMIQTRRKQLRR